MKNNNSIEIEEIYKFVFNNLLDGVYILFKEKFIIVNPVFENLFGYSKDELKADNFKFWDLIAPESLDMIKERQEFLSQGEPLPSPYIFSAIHKNGHNISVEANVKYFSYKDGIAVLGIVRDISKRNEYDIIEIKNNIRNIVGDIKIIYSKTFISLYKKCQFYGGGIYILEAEKILAVPLQEDELKVKPRLLNFPRRYLNVIKEKGLNYLIIDEKHPEFSLIKDQLSQINIVLIIPIRIEEIIVGILMIGEDRLYKINGLTINLYQAASEALASSHGLLRNSDEIRKKQEKIEKINSELCLLNEKRKKFLGDLQHEIVTPINAIMGHTSYLIELYDQLNDDTRKSVISDVLDEANRLKELLLDIENVAALDIDNREPVLVFSSIIRTTISMLNAQLKAKNIEIISRGKMDLPQLIIDKKRFIMILSNIIRNIVKYSHANTKAYISVGRGDDRFYYLDFENYGIGIPKGEDEFIFEEGYRGSNVDKFQPKIDGQGLGLYFAKTLLKKYNSDIIVINNDNPTIFRVLLSKSLRHSQ